jgi:hypothetical protein
MNRNATGMVGGAMLLSMLSSPPRPPAIAGGTASRASAVRTEARVEAGSESEQQTGRGGAWKPRAFAEHGRQDAAKEMAQLFLDVCQEDSETTEVSTREETGTATSPESQIYQSQRTIADLCQPSPDDFVIALVPDPVHTRLALIFDRVVEVIQEAAQDAGHSFVKAYLPWDSKAHPEGSDPAAWLEAKAYAQAREEYPGLLAFRDSPTPEPGGRQRHLFVLLVAESPTGGIAKQQFLHAVEWIQATARTRSSPDHPIPPDQLELRILGPTFSGSLASLAQLLRCPGGTWYRNSHIFSGSVSDRKAVLDFLAENDPAATFASFQEADDVMIERFRDYLAARGQGPRSLAILSEDETEYGAGARDEGAGGRDEGASGADRVSGCPRATRTQELEAGLGCLYLYFPREISRLRAAYQSNGVGSSKGEAQSAPRGALPLNLEISGDDDDSIASFSKQTPLSQEGVLLGIVSELRLNAIRFVVLRATDPLDLLFLSRYLAAADPKVRIVTIRADMLFRREVEDKQLHGTLALSTYSLADFANRGFADSLAHPQRKFPSSTEAGTYNALRSLLETPAGESPPPDPGHSRYQIKGQHLLLYQYGWLEGWRDGLPDPLSFTPPVHLLALGRDEYWPIAHLGPIRDPSKVGKPIPTLLPEVSRTQFRGAPTDPLTYHAPVSWVVAEVIAVLLALAFAGALWFSSTLSSSPILVQFAATGSDSRQSMVVAFTGVLTAIFLVLLFPFVAGNGLWRIDPRLGLPTILYAALAALLLVSLTDTLDHRRLARLPASGTPPRQASTGARGGRSPRAIVLAVLDFACVWLERRRDQPAGGTAARSRGRLPWISLVVLLAIATWLWLWWVPDSPTGAWRHAMLRSIQLTSGVSPVLPMLLLLAAELWWTLQVSAGYLLLDARCPRLPMEVHRKRVGFIAETVARSHRGRRDEVSDVERASAEDAYMVAELRRVLLPEHLFTFPYLAPFTACLALPIVLRLSEPLMTLEHPFFGWVLWYLFLLPALALICGTTARLWRIWLKTRRLLTMLDSLPLRRGFQELAGFSWKPLWRLGLASSAEAQRIGARVREARAVAENTKPGVFGHILRPARDPDLETIRKGLEDIRRLRRPFWGDWRQRRELEMRLVESVGSIQEANAHAAGRALDYLAQHWEKEDETPRRRRPREDDDELSVRACERFVCLLYVSFLVVVLERMRTLMVAIGGTYILVLLAMTSYPFQPRATIVTVLAILLFFIIAVVTVVFAQVHRNTTLSHITNTNPGELGGDFWLKTGSFVALPLFTFLVSQFPELNRFLYSWVEPALKALNK